MVLGTGADGSTFYSSLPGGVELITDLTGIGLRVMERRWISGWLTPGFQLKSLSERYAVLLDWIHANEHQGGLFFAVGNSGGSGEIAFALERLHGAAHLHLVERGAASDLHRGEPALARKDRQHSPLLPAEIETVAIDDGERLGDVLGKARQTVGEELLQHQRRAFRRSPLSRICPFLHARLRARAPTRLIDNLATAN